MRVEILDMLQILTPIAIGIVGWGVRLIWNEIRSSHEEIRESRTEMREELREYVRRENCRVHREQMQRQIDDIAKKVA